MGTIVIAALLAWVVLAILAGIAQFRFFAALRAHESGAAAPDDAVLAELAEQPSRFVSIMVAGNRARASALFHRSRYPEVERQRRLALALVLLMVIALASLPLIPVT